MATRVTIIVILLMVAACLQISRSGRSTVSVCHTHSSFLSNGIVFYKISDTQFFQGRLFSIIPSILGNITRKINLAWFWTRAGYISTTSLFNPFVDIKCKYICISLRSSQFIHKPIMLHIFISLEIIWRKPMLFDVNWSPKLFCWCSIVVWCMLILPVILGIQCRQVSHLIISVSVKYHWTMGFNDLCRFPATH